MHLVQVDAGERFAYRKRDRLSCEHLSSGWALRCGTQPESGLVELGGAFRVAYLESDKVWSGHGGVQDRGLITRPSAAPHGRALPTQLTDTGREALATAKHAVTEIESQMVSDLSLPDQQRLRHDLLTCTDALARPRAANPER